MNVHRAGTQQLQGYNEGVIAFDTINSIKGIIRVPLNAWQTFLKPLSRVYSVQFGKCVWARFAAQAKRLVMAKNSGTIKP